MNDHANDHCDRPWCYDCHIHHDGLCEPQITAGGAGWCERHDEYHTEGEGEWYRWEES